jgi:hypothetical protein
LVTRPSGRGRFLDGSISGDGSFLDGVVFFSDASGAGKMTRLLALRMQVRVCVRSTGSNMAHTPLGGRAAVMGKVGDDDFGHELVYPMRIGGSMGQG